MLDLILLTGLYLSTIPPGAEPQHAPAQCGQDAHEGNDRRRRARALSHPVDAATCVGDPDWYRFEAGVGEWVTVTATYSSGTLEGLQVFRPRARTPFPVDRPDGGRTRVRFRAPVTGTYRLRIRSRASIRVSYRLEVHRVVE